MKNPLAVGSIIVLILIVLLIVFGRCSFPMNIRRSSAWTESATGTIANMAPFQYSELEQEFMAEGGKIFPHIMGTDEMGRDYFVRVLYGTRVSLIVGVFAAVIVLIIGNIYGSISGYFGGKVDLVMMRIVDIIYSLPDTLMVVLLSVVLNEVLNVEAIPFLQKIGTNMLSMFVVFALLYWVSMARLVRGQILTIKQNDYVLAAKVSGAKSQTDHFPSHPAQLHQRHHYFRRSADPFRDLYGKLLKLYRNGRTGSHAFPRLSGERGQSRNQRLSLEACVPVPDDLPDHARLQPAGRRPARRVRS